MVMSTEVEFNEIELADDTLIEAEITTEEQAPDKDKAELDPASDELGDDLSLEGEDATAEADDDATAEADDEAAEDSPEGEEGEDGEDGEDKDEDDEDEEEPTPTLQPGDTVEAAESSFVNRYDEDIEDEFADFVDEELGYAEIDWDTLPAKEVDKHNTIRQMTLKKAKAHKLGRSSDFCRWALAKTFLGHGDIDAFHKTALPLITSKKRSPALDYVDILLALVGRKASTSNFDAAFSLLDEMPKLATDEPGLERRFRAILTIQQGDTEKGLEMLASLAEDFPSDASFLLSIGEDLCGLELWEEALEYLEVAQELSRGKTQQELLVSIENAVQFAQRRIRYDEFAEN